MERGTRTREWIVAVDRDDRGADPDGAADRIERLRALARTELAPVADAGTHGRVNRDLVRALAATGLLPRLFPRELGGAVDGRVSASELCTIREALAAESPTAETTLAVQGLGCYPILLSGSDTLARHWVSAVAEGRAVAAFALTEPGAGSDAAALELIAEPDGSGYRLTGEKVWISHAPDADVYTVFARTTPGAGARGVTAFVVPGDSDGLSGQPLDLLASHAIGRLSFEGVRVGPDQVLGEVDAGFRVAMTTLDRFRPSVGAAAVGLAQAALEAALNHADARQAFGGPLRQFQAVSHRLADMATSIQAARLLVRDAAAAHDRGERATRQAAMAKLFATEMAQEVIDGAVQVHGASGLERGHLLEHLYREVRALRIYEGTSEIQRTIIARELYRAE
jgi:acyl-CoA dehydrogenase